MLEFLLKYKEIINIIFALVIGLIPTIFDVRNRKRNINSLGYFTILLSVIFILISIFSFNIELEKIKPGDLSITFNLRVPNSYATDEEIRDLLDQEYPISRIRIGKSELAGKFVFQNIHDGKSRVSPSKFVTYYCVVMNYESILNFPKYIYKLNPNFVIVSFSFEKLEKIGFSLDGEMKLKIRDKEYLGERDKINELIRFKK